MTCSITDCGSPVKARGLCNAHYCRDRRHGSPALGGAKRHANDDERLAEMWSRITVAESGCWTYTGALTSGYGTVHYEGRAWRVHRIVYTLKVGLIPDGLTLDHTCHTNDPACRGGKTCPHRACCNPDHLEPVTAAENKNRGGNARKTTCPLGHEYDTVIHRPAGPERRCSICERRKRSERTAREAAAQIAQRIGTTTRTVTRKRAAA